MAQYNYFGFLNEDLPNQVPMPGAMPGVEEEEEGLQLPWLGTVPSGRQLADIPHFDSAEPNEGTARAFKGAKTEVDRLTERMTSAGYGEEVSEILEEGEGSSLDVLTPLFDVLQIGQFTTVGFVQELQRTGQIGPAIEQAAIEFANALPGIEFERARRPGWSEVLRESDMFGENESMGNRWGAPALGFLMDVFLDPTTYTGFGTLKALRALRGYGGTAGVIDALARASMPGAQGFGEKFLPHFELRQFALRGGDEAKAAVDKYLERRLDMFGTRDTMLREMDVVARDLRAGLNDDEARLLTMFMDQPDDKFRMAIREYLEQTNNAERVPFVMEKAKVFREAWEEWGQKEIDLGVLDEATVRYVPAREPQTRASDAIWKDFMDGRLFPDRMKLEDIAPEFRPPGPMQGGEKAMFNHAKHFETIQQRIAAGMPTEFDIGLSTLRRGFEHVRAVSSRKFLKQVLDDRDIVRPLDHRTAEEFLRSGEVALWKERGYVPVNVERYLKAEPDATLEGLPEEFFAAVQQGDTIRMMPQQIFEHLKKANQVMSDPTAAQQFWGSFQRIQGIWKGYALLSPGYHMRNQYSNIFQNWLAGVTHPKRYAMAMALQAGGTDALPGGVRNVVEGLIGRRTMDADDIWMTANGKKYSGLDMKEMIDESGVGNTGMFTKDMMIDAEKQALTSMDRSVRRVSLQHLSTAGAKFEQMLAASADNLTSEEVHSLALLWDAKAKTYAWQTGTSVEDYFRTRIHGIYRGGDAGEGEHVLWQSGEVVSKYSSTVDRRFLKTLSPEERQSLQGVMGTGRAVVSKEELAHTFDVKGKKVPLYTTNEYFNVPTDKDQLFLPHGERIEVPLHKLFEHNPMPTAASLRKIPGGQGFNEMALEVPKAKAGVHLGGASDYRTLVEIAQQAKRANGGEASWYKEWGNEIREEVGDANMYEAGYVFSIMSRQNNPEDNLSETYMVMRMARKYWNGRTFNEDGFRTALTLGKGRSPEVVAAQEAALGPRTTMKLKDVENYFSTAPRRVQVVMGEVDKGIKMTGDQVDALVEVYQKGTFTGNLKTTTFALDTIERGFGNNFFPFTTNDVHIARLFGYGVEGKLITEGAEKGKRGKFDHKFINGDQYRHAQYLIARVAKDLDVDPDEMQAMLWFYAKDNLSTQTDKARYGHLGGPEWDHIVGKQGSWKSAQTYAEPEAAKLRNMENFDREVSLPGWEHMELNYNHNQFGSQSKAFMDMTARIAALSTRTGELAFVHKGGLGVGVAATRKQITDFHSDVLDKTLTSDGTQLKALLELDKLFGVKHRVVHNIYGSFEGNIEPSVSVIVEGTRNDLVGDVYAAIVGDGLAQDAAVSFIPKRFDNIHDAVAFHGSNPKRTAFGVDVTVRRPFTEKDYAAIAERFKGTGIDFTGHPDGRGMRFFKAGVSDEEAAQYAGVAPRGLHPASQPLYKPEIQYRGAETKWDAKAGQAGRHLPDKPSTYVDEQVGPRGYTGLTDEEYYDEIATVLKEYDADAKVHPFIGMLGYHERGDYAEIIREARGELARVKGLDASALAGRIYRQLHKQYDDVFSDHASRNGWREAAGGKEGFSPEYRARLNRDTAPGSGVHDGLTDVEGVRARDPMLPVADVVLDPDLRRVIGSPLHSGMALDEGTGALFQTAESVRKASVEFDQETGIRGLMRLFEHHDVSSVLHESAHIWRRDLDGDDLALVEKWAGAKDGKWTRPAEERFARGFEKYMREGKAPTPMLEGVFSRAKEWLENIYAVLKGSDINVRINDDVRDVFDRMLGKGTLGEVSDLTMDVMAATPTARGVSGMRSAVSEVLARTVGTSAPHMRVNRLIGRAMENNSRIAHFLDKFEGSMLGNQAGTGGDKNFARASVNKYLFDYDNGLTDFEQNVMRSVIPFYSWMRFNIPLQMQAIMEDPARYAKVPKFIQAIESVTDQWRAIETPDYFEELNAIRLPLIQNSKPVYLNPNLPFQDLNRLNSRDMLSSMTPFLKIFGEMMPKRGYSTHMDRPLERYPGEESEVIPGLTKKMEHGLSSLLPTFGKIQRQFKAADRGELPSQLVSELAGIKLTNVDQGRVVRGNTFAQRELLRAMKKRLEADGVNLARPATPSRLGRRRRRQRKKRRLEQ